MRNRSYIGDGVYASFSGRGTVLIELEQGRPIELNRDTFHALMEYIQKNNAMFDPHCQLIEVPHQVFPEVFSWLKGARKGCDQGWNQATIACLETLQGLERRKMQRNPLPMKSQVRLLITEYD